MFFVLGVLAGALPVYEYATDSAHYVHRVPMAILATGLVLLSAGFAFLGLALHAVNWRIKELHNVMVRGKR